MSETPPRYRTLDRPGPGLATIEEPDRREELWSLNLHGTRLRQRAQCGMVAGRLYRPSIGRGPAGPYLCRPCVEGIEDA